MAYGYQKANKTIIYNLDKEILCQRKRDKMAHVNVLLRKGEIDGKAIEWQVLQVTGTLDGLSHTLELKLSKTEAMLARILLASSENLTVDAVPYNGENVPVGSKKITVIDESETDELGF